MIKTLPKDELAIIHKIRIIFKNTVNFVLPNATTNWKFNVPNSEGKTVIKLAQLWIQMFIQTVMSVTHSC